MAGGAHRGPVAPSRQRRTIRFMQGLLVVAAAGLLVLAGYSMGRTNGYETGRRASEVGPPRRPSNTQTVVLIALGLVAFGGSFVLGGPGAVRVPTPARLDELAGRAESEAIERAEEAAASAPSKEPGG